jgi:DNA topoisomerase-2
MPKSNKTETETKSEAEKYDKKTPREHVLLRPDTYIGDIEPTSENMWVYSDSEDKMLNKQITYTPGFLKTFDELIVNARDASINDPTCDTIKVEYNSEEGYISVFNNGDIGIPVEEHPTHKSLVPSMIFGELLTSSNYNDNEERTTGGRNGYGSKCLCPNTKIPMWNGETKLAKDVQVGDQLIGDNGTIRNVLKIITGTDKMYNVIQENGETYKVNSEHILTLTLESKQNKIFDIPIHVYLKFHDSLRDEIYGVRGKCVKWENQEVPFDAYFFGMWLGDCIQSDSSYPCYGGKLYNVNQMLFDSGNEYNVNKTRYNSLTEFIKIYKLNESKYIPIEYIVNDSNTRLKVLAGILDRVGSIRPDKLKIIISYKMNDELENDIIKLCRTLGFSCYKQFNYISISGSTINDIPTKIFKKYGCVYNNDVSTGHIKIEEVDIGEFVGFEIDSNQRFLINDFTVTHNCANIFSTKFIVEIDDAKRNKRFKQSWINNMETAEEAFVTKLPAKTKSSVKVTFYPDFKRFNIKDLKNDHMELFHRRSYDIAGTANNKLKVFFNDKKIDVVNFKSYIELYYPTKDIELYYDNGEERWTVGVLYKPDKGGDVISFVNSINTYKGGTHCNHVIDNIIKTLINDYIKKKDKDIKITPTILKENLVFFINSTIINPAFSSQTKDTLTTKIDKFGSKYTPTPVFLKKLAKCGIVEQMIELAKFKENSNLKKTDGKKQVKISGIPKLEDANKAGTKESNKCTLILTEGDSAKATAMAGLGIIGRDYYGVFPLKGKLLNVREAAASQLLANEEIKNLKLIIGLKQGEDYSSDDKFSTLRYGHVLLLTDQDVDGSHIKGLFINMLHSLWPSLVKKPEFVQSLNTPIVKAIKGSNVITFYNLTDYDNWKDTPEANNYKIKYYKGLGTSTTQEAKEYFIDIETKLINYFWENVDKEVKAKFSDSDKDKPEQVIESESENEDAELDDTIFIPIHDDDDAIRLAFDKSRADDRKKWLLNYNKNNIIKYEQKTIPYYDFIHYDLIHFSNDDLIRSIPSVIDGLKPSQRKILYGAYLRGLDKTEVKVAQLAGFVSDKAAYHHGEMSLTGAIIGMAQDFVGSNNINILVPAGQFGTRLKGGKDAASPRYIWTSIEKLTSIIYNSIDDPILNNQFEDSEPIEPEYYAPIIPMVLVNGAEGIGTGFSTKIPPYNPIEIIKNIKNIMNSKPFEQMDPWWQGFEGMICKIDNFNYEIFGTWSINDNKLTITELPVGEWTSNYKEFLEKMLEDVPVKTKADDKKSKKVVKKDNNFLGYKDSNTESKVHFELTFEDGYLQSVKDLDKLFHLNKKYSVTNMHLYGPEGHIKRYHTVEEIMNDYYEIRLNLYKARKEYQLSILEYQLKIISFKVKFILMVVKKEIEINNKKKQDIEDALVKNNFPKFGKNKSDNKLTYDYLLTMPIYNLSYEKIEELKKQQQDKESEYKSLEELTPQNIWLNELEILEEEYIKWYANKTEIANLNGKKKVKKNKK